MSATHSTRRPTTTRPRPSGTSEHGGGDGESRPTRSTEHGDGDAQARPTHSAEHAGGDGESRPTHSAEHGDGDAQARPTRNTERGDGDADSGSSETPEHGDGEAGADGEANRTFGQKMGDWAKDKAKEKATEFAGEKAKELFTGKKPEEPSAGPRPSPSYGPPSSTGSDAYGWTRAVSPPPMAPLPVAALPDKSGLTGWLDHNVEHALKASGIMHYLEKVTGNLDELNNAAEEWQAQAKAVQNIAEALRAECRPLAQQWEGSASDAFGRHMGEVVEALDSTADGMYQTAQIISQAAAMCALAEGMVIEIISEAIEALIASLAVEAVVAVLTLGIGLIVDAMVDAAEIAAFIARVARVSEELAQNLEKLLKALKELGSAAKAVRSLREARTALKAVREVKSAVKGLREMEQGGEDAGKIFKDAKEARSLEGVAGKVGDLAARKAAGWADGKATEWLQGEIKQDLFGDSKDDAVDFGGRVTTGKGLKGNALGTLGSFGGASGQSALGVVKGAWSDPDSKALIEGSLEGEAGDRLQNTEFGQGIANSGFGHLLGETEVGKGMTEHDPAPYRVDKSRIEQAFG